MDKKNDPEKEPDVDSPSDEFISDSEVTDVSTIKAPDGGWGWIIVISSFFFQSIIDGTFSIFGVFLPHFLDYYGVGRGKISIVGSALTACFLMSGPFVSILCQCIGCRTVAMLGGVFITTGFVLSTITPCVEYMVVTFGIIAGIGLGMIYLPSVVVCGQYFEQKRALAMGIASSGSGIGMLIMAPLSAVLLEIFEWKNALILISGIALQSVIFGALLRPLEYYQRIKRGNLSKEISSSTESCEDICILNDHNKVVKPVPSVITSPGQLRKIAMLNAFQNHDSKSHAFYPSLSQDKNLQSGVCKDNFEDLKYTNSSDHINCNKFKKENDGKLYQRSIQSLKYNDEYGQLKNDECSQISQTCGNLHEMVNNSSSYGNRRYSSCHNIGTAKTFLTDKQKQAATRIYKQKLLSNPFLRKDIFYSGSLFNLPDYKTCDKSYIATLTIDEINTVQENESQQFIGCIKKEYLITFKKMLDVSVLTDVSFIVICLGNVFMQMGYFIPIMFLPDYALGLGMDTKYGATLMSVFGVCNTIGRLSAGALANVQRINSVYMVALSMIASGLACASCVLCKHFITLVVSVGCVGLSIAPIIPLTNVFLVKYLGLNKLTSAVGLLSLHKGAVCIFGPPLAGTLLDSTGTYVAPFAFAGSVFVLSGIVHFFLLKCSFRNPC